MPKRTSGRSQPKRSMASFHGMRCSGNSCSTPAADSTSWIHALHQVHDVGFLHEGHLDVHLREFRLTVGAQVLVAEAAGNLVVALDAGRP